ncbi:MAG: hypothetical protein ASUL_02404 [Candidatus Aramenus sulfurataquae]|jgi:hypothetical protein|uniref:DUF5751 domain-containing protein n=2 Tax=Candidatus Aramenus sulfurataquae TaxID=1326980 RepID=W7KP55_9CREN|nr:MAG: hypothetical protein ASUL_02404 [Candidatus Aramenus sulfurataquae]MCL7344164.1 hypothetical protein [Candidatus Aramenus sulfurataquae]
MESDYRPVVAIFSAKLEENTDLFRLLLREVRALKGRKVIVHVLEDVEYWNFLASAREAILDNIDLGLEIYVWKTNDFDKMLKKVQEEKDIKGIITVCGEENKYALRKMLDLLSNSIKANMLKDLCK